MTRAACALIVLLALGCATSPGSGRGSGTSTDPGVAPGDPSATDVCAQFAREQQAALGADEHMKTFGCPPCPCACVNGQITCAPCAACESFQQTPDPDPSAPNLVE